MVVPSLSRCRRAYPAAIQPRPLVRSTSTIASCKVRNLVMPTSSFYTTAQQRQAIRRQAAGEASWLPEVLFR